MIRSGGILIEDIFAACDDRRQYHTQNRPVADGFHLVVTWEMWS
ncbi:MULTISPECIES: hypothetical protein [Arthrospira]|nr:hypothetical protein [Arthrospira platensis]MDT9310129.1 hypothetical protein [Limnospira sp. Paracas R14]WAK74098.1 hypothetical protein AP9108_36760 [Arthrospira sp. PCC 9108]